MIKLHQCHPKFIKVKTKEQRDEELNPVEEETPTPSYFRVEKPEKDDDSDFDISKPTLVKNKKTKNKAVSAKKGKTQPLDPQK